MPDVQVKLAEFSDLIDSYTDGFVGREWLAIQVNELLDDPACRFVVLTGHAGEGKSAFMAHLAVTHTQWPRYFIRRDSREILRSGDAKVFLLTIGGQLATLRPDLFKPKDLEIAVRQRIEALDSGGEVIGLRVEELKASPFSRVSLLAEQEIRRVTGKAVGVEIGRLITEPRQMTMQDLQYLGLLAPAWLLYQQDPQARIVVLVDALDELRYSPAEVDVLDALCQLPGRDHESPAQKLEMPPNLRFVVSSRPELFLNRLLARSDARELQLDVGGKKNQNDLRTYALANLPDGYLDSALLKLNTTRNGFLTGLLDKASGNFLYLRSVLHAIKEALADSAKVDWLDTLLQVEGLPDNLDHLYDYFLASIVDWIKRSGFGDSAWRQYLRPLLGTLAVAQEPVSEPQLMALSGLGSEDVRDLLRELRQFVEPVRDRAAFRIFHSSFAEYLLDANSNVDYRIDGQHAHQRVVDRYMVAWGGLENGLLGLQQVEKRDLDEGYGVRHLVAHLAGANRNAELHELLHLERRLEMKWENVWYGVKEAGGDSSGYLTDVRRGWAAAEADSTKRLGQKEVAKTIALEISYALITATANSFAGNIPPALLRALVQRGTWTCPKGFSYAAQVPDPVLRAETLTELAEACESVSDRAFREAVTAVSAISDIYWKEAAIARLATKLPDALRHDLLQQNPRAVQSLIDAYSGGREQESDEYQLFEQVDENELSKSLAAAESLRETDKVARITELLPQLTGALLDQAVTMAKSVKEEFKRTLVMTRVVLRLLEVGRLDAARLASNEIAFLHNQAEALMRFLDTSSKATDLSFQDNLAAVESIKDPYWRAAALTELASRHPAEEQDGILRQALAAARTIGDEGQQGSLITSIAVCLNDLGELNKALEALEAIRDEQLQAQALMLLIPKLPDQALDAVLGLARSIGADHWRAKCLGSVASHLSDPDRSQVLREALEATNRISDKRLWVQTSSELIPHLLEPLKQSKLEDLLDAVCNFENEHSRAEGLVSLTMYLTDALLRRALELARAMTDSEAQSQALAEIAVTLARSGHTDVALRLANIEIADTFWRQKTLRALSKVFAESNLPTLAVQVAENIEYEHWLGGILAVNAAFLSDEWLMTLVAKAREIDDLRQHAVALAKLSRYLPEANSEMVLRESLKKTNEISDQEDRARTMADLAPYLAGSLLSDAVAAVIKLKSSQAKVYALGVLLPRLARSNQQQQVIDIVNDIKDSCQRARVLAHLYPYMAESRKQEILLQIMTAIQSASDSQTQLGLINTLAPYLDSIPPPQIYACWRKALLLLSYQDRGNLMIGLHTLLPVMAFLGGAELLEDIVDTALKIDRWWPSNPKGA